MPGLEVNDDCKDGVEALSRVMAVMKRRKASRISIRQKVEEPPPVLKPEPAPKPERESVIVAKPLRANRNVSGKLINFLDFTSQGHGIRDSGKETFVSLNLILVQTAHYFSTPDQPMSVEDLRSNQRLRPLVNARMVASYLAKKLTTFSYPEIGRRLCKDHSTVVHHITKMKNILAMRQEQNMGLIHAAEIIERRVLES